MVELVHEEEARHLERRYGRGSTTANEAALPPLPFVYVMPYRASFCFQTRGPDPLRGGGRTVLETR